MSHTTNILQSETPGREVASASLGTAFTPYNGLANRRLQPLGHLSSRTCGVAIVAVWGVLWGSWLKHLQLAEPFGLCSRVPASDETPFFCSYPGLGIRSAPSKRVGH